MGCTECKLRASLRAAEARPSEAYFCCRRCGLLGVGLLGVGAVRRDLAGEAAWPLVVLARLRRRWDGSLGNGDLALDVGDPENLGVEEGGSHHVSHHRAFNVVQDTNFGSNPNAEDY